MDQFVIKPNEWKKDSLPLNILLKNIQEKYGSSLPEEYISFLKKYNGGAIFPCHFENKHPLLLETYDEKVSIFQNFYDSTKLNELLSYDNSAVNWPPNTLPIGAVNGGDEIILSLEKEDYGKIKFWVRVMGLEWGNEYNQFAPIIADSFKDFIFNLYFDKSIDEIPAWYTSDKRIFIEF